MVVNKVPQFFFDFAKHYAQNFCQCTDTYFFRACVALKRQFLFQQKSLRRRCILVSKNVLLDTVLSTYCGIMQGCGKNKIFYLSRDK